MQNLSYNTALPTDRGARVAATIAALTNCTANFAVMHRIAVADAGEDVANGCLEFLAGYLSTQPDGLEQARHIAAQLIVSQLPAPEQAAHRNSGSCAPNEITIDAIPSDVEPGDICYV